MKNLYLPVYYLTQDHPKSALSISNFSKMDANILYGQKKLMKEVFEMREKLTETNFESTLLKFLKMSEGCVLFPYLDSQNHFHIGHGLLLKLSHSNEYEKLAILAFQSIGRNLNKELPISSLLTSKSCLITQNEADKILLFVLKYMSEELIKKIPYFKTLNLNMQISILSLYYNCPALIGPKFLKSLNLFYLTRNDEDLIGCIHKIAQGSNIGAPYYGKVATQSDWKGVQYRRDREMLMFSSFSLDEIIFEKSFKTYI